MMDGVDVFLAVLRVGPHPTWPTLPLAVACAHAVLPPLPFSTSSHVPPVRPSGDHNAMDDEDVLLAAAVATPLSSSNPFTLFNICSLPCPWQSGPTEITTRWTMKMYFWLLPWRPEVVFTGLSIYGIDPRSQQFISHRDVRDYPAYQVVQVNSPVQSAADIWPSAPGTPPSPQVEKLKRYFQGANSQRKTIPEGPLMLSSPPESAAQDRILAIAVPLDADAPTPTDPDLTVVTMPRGTWAAVSFGGLPLVETFSSAAAALRADATSDGLLLASRGAGSDRSTDSADSTATDAVKGGTGLGAAASALVSYPSA
ncbi:unnamed protein product [Closterium sp. Naga37s-1]|nr:unnamed protein product [Closterium sp. Naga37s-1]